MNSKVFNVSVLALSLIIGGAGISSAYGRLGGDHNANLTDAQKEIINQAQALRKQGDFDGAKTLMENSGLFNVKMNGPKMDAVQKAIDDNDYQAFLDATKDHPGQQNITEDIFAKMVEANNLRKSGDVGGANALMKEIGFGPINRGERPESNGKNHLGRDMSAVKTAIENDDYQAFLDATKDTDKGQMSQEDFEKMVVDHKDGKSKGFAFGKKLNHSKAPDQSTQQNQSE